MDKEWMSKNRLSCEYEDGVELFLQFALQNCLDSNQIPCPCAKCGNLKKKNVITIRAHLCCHGMDLTYHTWIFHGEKSKLATIVDERNEMFEGDQHQEEEDIIKAPLQPDSKQCGFFVMRYTREIIDELANNGSISLKSLFEHRRYSQEEIDEVRIEWANCVLEHI